MATVVAPGLASDYGAIESSRDLSAKHARSVSICAWTAVLAWCSLPLSPNLADSDFWGHVQYGRDAWNHGLPAESTYTYSAVGHPWINHEILSEMLFAYVADAWGSGQLVLLKSVCGLMMLASMIVYGRRRGSGFVATACVILAVAWSLSYYWSVRPQVVSFIFFGVMIATLTYAAPQQPHRSRGRIHGLWLLVPWMGIWANAHGGFLAGVAILSTYLGLRSIEWYRRTGEARNSAIAVAVVALAGLATLLNPYGIDLHGWLIDSLPQPRPEVIEWRSPDWLAWSALPTIVLLALVTVSAISEVRSRRLHSIDITQWILIALTIWQVTEHRRHVPFLAILCGFWLPIPFTRSLRQLLACCGYDPSRPNPTETSLDTNRLNQPAVNLLARIFACFGLLILAVLWGSQWLTRVETMRVDRGHFPVSAVQFMADRGITGKVFCTGRWGQYLLASLGAREPHLPGVTVGFDGRYDTCYPRSVVDLHFDFVLGPGGPEKRYRGADSPPFSATAILDLYEPTYLLLDRRDGHAMQVMQEQQPAWSLLYQDNLAQVWGRRSIVDAPSDARYLPDTMRNITSTPQAGFIPWPAAPVRGQVSFLGFAPPSY